MVSCNKWRSLKDSPYSDRKVLMILWHWQDVLYDLSSAVKNEMVILTTFVSSRLSKKGKSLQGSSKDKPKAFCTLYTSDAQNGRCSGKLCASWQGHVQSHYCIHGEWQNVNIDDLDQKELCAVQLSLATTDFALRSTIKAERISFLEAGSMLSELNFSNLLTCTIADQVAFVTAMGKPLDIWRLCWWIHKENQMQPKELTLFLPIF